MTTTNAETGWGWVMFQGALLLLGGIICLTNPLAGTISVLIIAGATFLVGGGVQLFSAFASSDERGGSRVAAGLLGILMLAFGVLILAKPLEGIVTLTFVAAIMIFVSGIVRTLVGMSLRPLEGWGWMVFGGVISFLLGIWIFFNPDARLLGLFLGIDLTISGITLIAFAFTLRRGL